MARMRAISVTPWGHCPPGIARYACFRSLGLADLEPLPKPLPRVVSQPGGCPWVLAGHHTNDATGAGSLGRLVRLTGRGGAGPGSIFVRSPIPHPGETPMTPT